MPLLTEACCPPMKVLLNPQSQCHIELDEESGKLESCDDTGDRLPPLKFCPWCGGKIVKGGRYVSGS